MKAKPADLIFISQINRDGSGVKPVPESYIDAMNTNPLMKDEKYKLHRLSLTEDTWLALGFNSFVVRMKEPPHLVEIPHVVTVKQR